MEDLIKKLEELFSQEDIVTFDDVDGSKIIDINESKLAAEVHDIACGELIMSNGSVNLFNVNIIRRLGYDVYPGDHDSFGWLTGCIEKDGKVLVFG